MILLTLDIPGRDGELEQEPVFGELGEKVRGGAVASNGHLEGPSIENILHEVKVGAQ